MMVSLMLMQDLDTEIVVATAQGTNTNATAVSANLVVDERQMNALFLDVVICSLSSLHAYIYTCIHTHTRTHSHTRTYILGL